LLARRMHFTPTAALEVILMLSPLGIYVEGEARQVTYRLNCSGGFGHLDVFEKMTVEWPSLLALGDIIVPFYCF
jgi:hypothetical protein